MENIGQLHALIVEDTQSGIDVLGALLQQIQINYTAVSDPRQAVQVAEQLAQVDLIFLDLEMPGLDGFALLTEIQVHPQLQAVPVVAYTSHLSEMSNARDAGFHSFLGKPLRASTFAQQISDILSGNPVWASRY